MRIAVHDTQDYISDIPKEEYIMSMVVNKESAMNNFLDADQVIKAEQEEIKKREEAISKKASKVGEAFKGFNDFLVGGAIGITGGILFIEFCSGMLKLAKKNHIIYGK